MQLVERRQIACILVRHLTKTRNENALMAGHGSIAFIGLSRSGLMVKRHPEEQSRVVLSHIKSNISTLATGLTYTIQSDLDGPYIVWGDAVDAAELEQLTKKNRK